MDQRTDVEGTDGELSRRRLLRKVGLTAAAVAAGGAVAADARPAAAQTSGHDTDTTDVHGIADTTVLATRKQARAYADSAQEAAEAAAASDLDGHELLGSHAGFKRVGRERHARTRVTVPPNTVSDVIDCVFVEGALPNTNYTLQGVTLVQDPSHVDAGIRVVKLLPDRVKVRIDNNDPSLTLSGTIHVFATAD